MRLDINVLGMNMSSFNPRICKRCDLISVNITKIINSFNPRICKRCDGNYYLINYFRAVSIHASVKDATTYDHAEQDRICFNPRICKRCDISFQIHSRIELCFNPRICKRCDAFSRLLCSLHIVSIHASVKDATITLFPFIFARKVSIHASVKDATKEIAFNIL